MGLQRTAGNAAVAAMLGRGRTAPTAPATVVGSVQRDGPGTRTAPAHRGMELLPFPSFGPPPGQLDFARRRVFRDSLPTICPRCHRDTPTGPMPSLLVDREATEERLVDWGTDSAETLHNDWLVRRLQLDPGGLGAVVDDYGTGLVQRIMSTHEFTGSQAARSRGAEIVRRRWRDIRPVVHDGASAFYRDELTTALAYTPPAASPVLDPRVLRAVLDLPPTAGVQLGRWGATARPGQRVGPFVIVNGTPWNVYVTRVGQPQWIYQIGAGDFITRHDPLVTAVASDVYDSTRWILDATPIILRAAAFGLGFSGSIVLVLAGIALDELATEMEADVEGRPGRTPLEILGSAGTQLLIDRFFHRLFGGARGVPSAAGAGRLAPAIERITDRAVPVVKRNLAAAERPLVMEALDRGAARQVSDPALRAQGYTVEVAIDSAGSAHVFRLKADGTWCRFSERICGLDLGSEVVAAARSPRSLTQGRLDDTRELLTEIGKEADFLARTYERMRVAGRVDLSLLNAQERALLDELAPSGSAADLSLRELRDLPSDLGLRRDIAAALRREEELVQQLYREGRPLYEIMRAASPSYASRTRVLTEAAGRDAAAGVRPRSGSLHVDHVVPLNEIVRMPGFDRLRPDRQLEIVNDVRNLRAIDSAANTSRGDRSWHDWANALLHYDAAALARMRALEDEIRTYLAGRVLALDRP